MMHTGPNLGHRVCSADIPAFEIPWMLQIFFDEDIVDGKYKWTGPLTPRS